MTTGLFRRARPGDVLVIRERDYCYGSGDLRLRLETIKGDLARFEGAEWVQIVGMTLRSDGSDYEERTAFVRVSALMVPAKPDGSQRSDS